MYNFFDRGSITFHDRACTDPDTSRRIYYRSYIRVATLKSETLARTCEKVDKNREDHAWQTRSWKTRAPEFVEPLLAIGLVIDGEMTVRVAK